MFRYYSANIPGHHIQYQHCQFGNASFLNVTRTLRMCIASLKEHKRVQNGILQAKDTDCRCVVYVLNVGRHNIKAEGSGIV